MSANGIIGKHQRLERNRYMTNTGYVRLRVRSGRQRKQRYILEHRHVMERHLGRRLRKRERVHHINGIKTDNRIENLQICNSHRDHIQKHIANGTWRGGRPRLTDVFSTLPYCPAMKTWFRRNPDHPKALKVLAGDWSKHRGRKPTGTTEASINFHVPNSWAKELHEIAKANGQNMSECVRGALAKQFNLKFPQLKAA